MNLAQEHAPGLVQILEKYSCHHQQRFFNLNTPAVRVSGDPS